jgi:hypothetical protein
MILDLSQEGIRITGTSRLKRGEVVEVCVDEHNSAMRCMVMWAGKPGSTQQGEAGLQILRGIPSPSEFPTRTF